MDKVICAESYRRFLSLSSTWNEPCTCACSRLVFRATISRSSHTHAVSLVYISAHIFPRLYSGLYKMNKFVTVSGLLVVLVGLVVAYDFQDDAFSK